MNFRDKFSFGVPELIAHGPITIVALGDSVTHGSVGFGDEMDYDTVYWNRLRKKLQAVNEFVPVNMINAGIGGDTATQCLKRLDSQVLAYHPDLVIVCYGLNDVNHPLESYRESLRTIFARCQAAGCEVVFLTPNMLNTYVVEDVEERYREYSATTAAWQNEGRMDAFMDAAREVAAEAGVAVCDCYAIWKEISRTQDTTRLLANRINHPTREMHALFADELYRMLLPDTVGEKAVNSSTMYVDQI